MFTKKIKSTIRRCMLTGMALMTAVPAAALTPAAAWGIGLGSAAVGGFTLYEIFKHHDKKSETCNKCDQKHEYIKDATSPKKHRISNKIANKDESSKSNHKIVTKKSNDKSVTSKHSKVEKASDTTKKSDTIKKLEKARKDLDTHNQKLDSLKKDGKADTSKAKTHKSEITRLENLIHDLEQKAEKEFQELF